MQATDDRHGSNKCNSPNNTCTNWSLLLLLIVIEKENIVLKRLVILLWCLGVDLKCCDYKEVNQKRNALNQKYFHDTYQTTYLWKRRSHLLT